MVFSTGLINFLFMYSERAKRSAALALAERAGLRQSEKRFRTLTEKSGDIIVILDSERIVRYVSPSVHGVLGLKAASLKGRDLLEQVRAEDAPGKGITGSLVGKGCGREHGVSAPASGRFLVALRVCTQKSAG